MTTKHTENILKTYEDIRMDLEWIWASPRRRQADTELPLASGQLTGKHNGQRCRPVKRTGSYGKHTKNIRTPHLVRCGAPLARRAVRLARCGTLPARCAARSARRTAPRLRAPAGARNPPGLLPLTIPYNLC